MFRRPAMRRFASVGCLAVGKLTVDYVLAEAFRQSQSYCVVQHIANGGCMPEFDKAVKTCNPGYVDKVDVEACIFAGNPQCFKHEYLHRLDHSLDEDLHPTWMEVAKEQRTGFTRWWTGMRRT